MIKTQDVVKRFDGFCALDNLSLNVPRGAVYGLVGPNGAGKSTLIRLLTGVFRQDSGSILIDGEEVWENPQIKNKIAFISDEVFYFPRSSITDMARFYKSVYPKFDEQRFKKLHDVFNLDDKMPIHRMSKGMQRQYAFWMLLCLMPELIILDEPVDGLDPVMRRTIWSLLISDVSDRGTTVLLSSHNLRELEDVCDHVGILNHGKMLLERSLLELQDNMVKLQVAFPSVIPQLPHGLNILKMTTQGTIHTIIAKNSAEDARALLSPLNPLVLDALPLTLEEIFIYELGGVDNDVQNIIL